MDDPPLDPKDATAAMATDMAELVAELLIELVRTERISAAEARALLISRLHPDPRTRTERVRQMLMQHVLLRLAGAAAGSSRA